MNKDMSETPFKISEVFITKENGRSTVRLFSATPTPLEEKNLGRLFAVLEIDSQDSINDDILDIIMEQINTHYYQAESFEVENAFEFALQRTNQRLQDLIAEIGDEWLSSLNVLIGVEKGGQLVFTNLGRVIALMIHQDRIIDVLDSTAAKAHEVNPVKVFSNVVTGELGDQSILVFATETILDYLSKEKIKRILTENTTETALEQFYSLLEEDTSNVNFAAMVLQRRKMLADGVAEAQHAGVAGEIPVVNRPEPQRLGSDSMSQLVNRESQTEELLSASLWPRVKKSSQQMIERVRNRKTAGLDAAQPEPRDEPETAAPVLPKKQFGSARQAGATASKAAKKMGAGLSKAGSISKNSLKKLGAGATSMAKKRKEKQAAAPSPFSSSGTRRSVSRTASSGIGRAVNWFKSLSLLQKAFFVVAIVVLLLFAQSVINRGQQNVTREEEQQYASLISDIDVKVNEGKAAVLYDRENARTLFIEARDMLEQIPTSSDTYQERGLELDAIITEELRGLNNIVELNDLSPAIDYSAINPGIQLSHIVLLGASMYAFDANNASVYRGNLENSGTTVTISNADTSRAFNIASKASPGTGIVGYTDGSFAVFNPVAESLEPLDLQYDEAVRSSIVDLYVFGVRLYALDPSASQIYRHRNEGGVFSAAEQWVTGSVNLGNAVSLAIDGDIFVLYQNGSVDRLSLGERDNGFSLAAIDPALDHGDELYTDENTERLYILDRSGNRVVVFEKNGSLVAQYTSPQFTNLIDMVVDEAEGRMFLLNGTQLFEVPLQSSVSGLDEESEPVRTAAV